MRLAMAADTRTRAARPTVRSRAEADDLVVAVLREHAESLLRVARRHSLCADDAQDAYQRGVEIFLRHAPGLAADEAHRWVHTVVKHEAMRIRAQRSRTVGGDDPDLDAQVAARLPSPDEQVASFDLLTRSAEALQRLKPQEVRALWLRAQGHSYEEIAEINGWTYTKVNRCLTEGRRAFLDRYAAIGAGEECRRWSGVLSAMADGEAGAKDLAAVRPHLRHCPACRAQLREMGEATRRVAVLLPVPVAAAGAADHGGLLARIHDAIVSLHDRIALSAGNLQAGAEAALPGKLAMVAASAAAVGGGVAVERAATAPPERPARRVAAARPAVAREASAPAISVVVREPRPPRPRAAAPAGPGGTRRTARSEFGVDGTRASRSSSSSTASREFGGGSSSPASTSTTRATTASAEVAPAPAPTAAPAPAPAPAPTPSDRDAQTAAAEFGG